METGDSERPPAGHATPPEPVGIQPAMTETGARGLDAETTVEVEGEAVDAIEPVRARRSPARWILAAGGVVVLAGAVTGVHSWANTTFDSAHEIALDAARESASAADSLTQSRDSGLDTVDSANVIVQSASDDLVDVAARDAFAATIETATERTSASTALLDEPSDDGAAVKPFWTWDIFLQADDLDSRAAALDERTADLEAADAAHAESAASLIAEASDLYASVAPAAAALEAANISARTMTVLDVRDSVEAISSQTIVGSGAATAFTTYAQRAEALKASNASELAEKAGPLYDTRLEIEAYARSISGGVVLDFDWAPIVAGTGGPNGIGGTATWNTVRGGFSTITFSHSVAEWWPSADARALVAHEVGHSITSKCWEMFDSDDQAANEEWATAWAISLGHTAVGNGVQAYGYPSQSMIDIAATCR